MTSQEEKDKLKYLPEIMKSIIKTIGSCITDFNRKEILEAKLRSFVNMKDGITLLMTVIKYVGPEHPQFENYLRASQGFISKCEEMEIQLVKFCQYDKNDWNIANMSEKLSYKLSPKNCKTSDYEFLQKEKNLKMFESWSWGTKRNFFYCLSSELSEKKCQKQLRKINSSWSCFHFKQLNIDNLFDKFLVKSEYLNFYSSGYRSRLVSKLKFQAKMEQDPIYSKWQFLHNLASLGLRSRQLKPQINIVAEIKNVKIVDFWFVEEGNSEP